MAGREFGPPPSIVKEFEQTWKQWLYLVYKKIYKRQFYNFIQAIDGIGDGQPSNTMAEGLIGICPVIFGQDNSRQSRNFSSAIPLNWVPGTEIEFAITFANVDAQAGDTAVVTEINYESTAIGEDLSLPGTPTLITTPLPTNVAANILHIAIIKVTPLPDAVPGRPFQFELARNGQDAADTCSGDVGYKEIVISYTGFINPE